MGSFATWVSAAGGDYLTIAVVLAVVNLIEALFANVNGNKKSLIFNTVLSAVALVCFGALELFVYLGMADSNAKTALVFVGMVLAGVYAIYTVVIALVRLVKGIESKSASMYQVFMISAGALAIALMLFVGLRQMDIITYSDALANKEYNYSTITAVPGIASNNLFLGFFLVATIVAAVGSLVVYIISLYKENKTSFAIVTALILLLVMFAVPLYSAVAYDSGSAPRPMPESISLPLVSLIFGTMEGLSVNPVLMIIPVLLLVVFVTKFISNVSGKGVAVARYTSIGAFIAAAVLLIVSLSIPSTVPTYNGSTYIGFVETTPVLQMGIGNSVYTKIALMAEYITNNEGSLYILAPSVGISSMAVVLSVFVIIFAVLGFGKEIAKLCAPVVAKFKKENRNSVKAENIDNGFTRFIGKFASLLAGVLVIVLIVVLIFTQQGFFYHDAVSADYSTFTMLNLMFGLELADFGVVLAPNLIAIAGFGLAIVAGLLMIIYTFVKGKAKNVLQLVGAGLLVVAGIALILVPSMAQGFAFYDIIMPSSFTLFGFLFIVIALLSIYKFTWKGIKWCGWFLANNVGITVTILCLFFLFLYWNGFLN